MNVNVYILERENKDMSSPDLLDTATKIAISAVKPNPRDREGRKPSVDQSTINNLLTFLQSRRNVNELLVYIMRQMGREEIDEQTGKLLLSSLKDKKVEEALTLLGYVKWIYETLTGLEKDYNSVKTVENFKKLVEVLSK